jgi:hypothetical protein
MIADAVKAAFDPSYEPVSTAADGLEVMRFIRSLKARL